MMVVQCLLDSVHFKLLLFVVVLCSAYEDVAKNVYDDVFFKLIYKGDYMENGSTHAL